MDAGSFIKIEEFVAVVNVLVERSILSFDFLYRPFVYYFKINIIVFVIYQFVVVVGFIGSYAPITQKVTPDYLFLVT